MYEEGSGAGSRPQSRETALITVAVLHCKEHTSSPVLHVAGRGVVHAACTATAFTFAAAATLLARLLHLRADAGGGRRGVGGGGENEGWRGGWGG